MKYLKNFENKTWDHDFTEENKIYSEMQKFKQSIYDNMDPDPIEVWHTIDDSILELKDKYGKFTDKFNRNRPIVEFDNLDINVDIKQSSDYSIAHIDDYTWKKIGNIDTRIYGDSKSEISHYGGDFDKKFQQYCKNNKVVPFYSMLIGFNSYYLDSPGADIKKCCEDLGETLTSTIKRLGGLYGVKITNIEELKNDWQVIPANINTLSNLSYPRVSLSFTIN